MPKRNRRIYSLQLLPPLHLQVKSSTGLIAMLPIVFLTVLISAVWPGEAPAQVDSLSSDTVTTDSSTVADILQQMEQELQATGRSGDSLIAPNLPAAGPATLDDSTRALYRQSVQAYYAYRISGFEHRKQVFAWQLFSSRIIFWIVLLLVFSGICFSGVQFYRSVRSPMRDASAGAGGSESIATEFEATAGGIKVSSPVLGVIILVISLAFFYLYLVYVYPISEIF